MEIKKNKKIDCYGIKFTAEENSVVVARAYLYIIFNDLHKEPFGLMEDVFVEKEHRSKGVGKKLIIELIEEARNQGCYKLIGQSRYGRPKVHEMYKNLGFKDHGLNFRMDLLN